MPQFIGVYKHPINDYTAFPFWLKYLQEYIKYYIMEYVFVIAKQVNMRSVFKYPKKRVNPTPLAYCARPCLRLAYCVPLTTKHILLVSIKLLSFIPRDLTASLLRPCYDPVRSTVAMDAAGTQRGRSEEHKDAQGRRPSANILNMHKTVAETLHSC